VFLRDDQWTSVQSVGGWPVVERRVCRLTFQLNFYAYIPLCKFGSKGDTHVPGQQLFVIDYTLHGESRAFIIRLEKMDDPVAWHWASCDAGVGIIPRFSQQNIKLVSRPMAEGYGIANVKWRLAGNGPEFIPQPIDVGKFSGAGEGA
jgi:hypothetical protein